MLSTRIESKNKVNLQTIHLGSAAVAQKGLPSDSVIFSPKAVQFAKLKPSFDIPQTLLDAQYQYYSAPILTKDDHYGLGADVRGAQEIAKDTLEKHYKLPSNPHGGLNGDLEAALRKAYNDSNGSPLSESQAQEAYAPLVTAIQKLGGSGVLGVNIHPRVATERPDIYEQFMSLGPVGNAAVASTIAQYGDMSLATTSLASVGLAADPIGELASNDFHWDAYREIKSGEALGAYALTEPQVPGSNPAGITATAIEDDNGNIHFESGQKMWITNGNIAKYILITARVKREGKVLEDSKGRPVLNAYLVSREELLAGATNSVGHKLSIEKSDTANVFLANIKPFNKGKHQLGPDGAGTTIYRDILSDGRVNVAMATAAKAQSAIRLSINYSKDRAFFPQVRDMLANGLAMTETAQLLALHAARLKERVEALKHEGKKDEAKKVNAQFVQAASVAKLFSTKWASPEALRNSIQAYGGMGIAEETGLSEPFKDAIVAAIYEGASEVQQNLIFGMTLGNLNADHGKNLKKYLLKSLHSEAKTVYDVLQRAENLALMTCLIEAKNKGKDIKDLMNDPQATLQHYTSRTANIITFNAAVKQLATTLQNRHNNKLDTKTDTLYLKLLLGRALEETLNNLTQMGALKADPDTTAVNLSKSKILSKTHKALSYIGLGNQLERMVDQKGGLNRQQIEDELRLYQKELNPIKSVEELIGLI